MPSPVLRKRPAKVVETLEQIAKRLTDKLTSPPGQPEKVEIALRLVLHREVLERIRAQAIRAGQNVAVVVAERLESAPLRNPPGPTTSTRG